MGFRGLGRAGAPGGGRLVAITIALAIGLVLVASGVARAGGRYSVVQCGWYAGVDADWADTTGGAKFRPDSYCAAPPADPFDGSHAKSLTREGAATVAGNRYARWRWAAPAGTGITRVSGTWWHALHDGIEQRVGAVAIGGGFTPFLSAAGTDLTPRNFVVGFPQPIAALEDRLLCARGDSSFCSLDPQSWSALRALTLTLEDAFAPAAGAGGELLAGGWRRGGQGLAVWGGDTGAGIRFGETTLDGNRVGLTEYPCATFVVGGQWVGTRMQPCPLGPSATQSIDTAAFSDGPHSLVHCVTDFSGNRGCTPAHNVLIDNNAPAHPREATVEGGEGWHRADRFTVDWKNPPQGAASAIGGASWRIYGPAGFDSGVLSWPTRDLSRLDPLRVGGPGDYVIYIWLRDETGNGSPENAAILHLRFDDVPPTVSFAVGDPDQVPAELFAEVEDRHSGPAGGTISVRREGSESWRELPTRLDPGDPGKARLDAALPDLDPGTYDCRAEAVDGAGNAAATTRGADGTQMVLHIPGRAGTGGAGREATGAGAVGASPVRARTRLFARLRAAGARDLEGARRGGARRGDSVTVPQGVPALLSGRLVRADGTALAGRQVRIVAHASQGARAKTVVRTVRSGPHGGFELRLPAATSRKLAVRFDGDAGFAPAARRDLVLRVRSGLSLDAEPRQLRTGETVRLRGTVLHRGASIPRRGKLVAIQYLEAASGKWRPVLVTRSDHAGRFHAHYRFRYVSGRATIRLRATALAEEGWPYAPGSSAPLTVRVSG